MLTYFECLCEHFNDAIPSFQLHAIPVWLDVDGVDVCVCVWFVF